jgi:MoxR-like ATPase
MDPLATLGQIRAQLKASFIERDELVDGALLALLARQHLLLIGPPGTAKSMLARALCRRIGGRYFEWLLTKFTTPEEVFGPVSLPALEQGRYERVTAHKLPEAEIAFLDEVFKANSAILNAFLTILNERRFYQGTRVLEVPLQSMIAASNELPEEEELEALFDRFLLRFTVGYIERDAGFRQLLALEDAEPADMATLDVDALAQLQVRASQVKVTKGMLAEITEIRRRLTALGVIASDRRYRQSLSVLKASALLHGRNRVNHRDLAWLEHMLWSDPEEQAKVLEVLSELSTGFEREARKLVRQAEEIEAYARRPWPDDPARQRALLEAHAKLEDIHRRLEGMLEQVRERGRDASALEVEDRRILAIQRRLLESEQSWQG